MDMVNNKLDGNAAGGILHEIFPFEMTLVQATCAGLRQENVVGALAVYMHGMGRACVAHERRTIASICKEGDSFGST